MSVFDSYNLEWQREIPEISTLALFYRHKRTGAEVLILENNDENKVFGVGFRTLADNSTGVAHILEHSVLGGSRKYPMREPFLELLKSSLQTFLNAFTYPDKTVYPVASQNTTDFYNLVDVYLDAVFHPRLSQLTFAQEGWHHELNEKGEPYYKGIVFNEMKGAYSDPDSILTDNIFFELCPDNEYHFDQGGDPLEIPNLTYADFVKFHQTHYHPSNARIFFYGDGDREKHLESLEAYLKDFSAGEQTIIPGEQPRFTSAKVIKRTYPTNPESPSKAYATVNWLLQNLTNSLDKLGMEVLHYMLLGSDAAPLKNALLESELGEDLSGIGYETDVRQHIFSTGLKGVKEEDIEKVERLILDKLTELVRDGIPADVVKGAVNRLEFEYRESRTGSYPRGLVFFIRSLQNWLYGGDPLENIFFAEKFKQLHAKVDAGERYFEQLIQAYLLDNNHRLNLRLVPDTEHIARRDAQEQKQLADFTAQLTAEQRAHITQLSSELEEWQKAAEKPEDLAMLPALHLTDIDKQAKHIPQTIERVGAAEAYIHDLQTDGIAYLAAGFEITNLPQELLAYLAVFSEAMMRLGTHKYTYEEMATRIDLDTGGINALNFISPSISSDTARLFFFLDGKSTVANVDKLLGLMRELFVNINLNQQDKFKQVILEEKAKLESALVHSGHAFASNRVAAHYRQACVVSDELSGISYLFNLRKLLELVEKDWESAYAQFERLYHLIIQEGKLTVNFTADAHGWDVAKPLVAKLAADFPDNHGRELPKVGYKFLTQDEGFVIPASVNFVGQSFDLTATGYELGGVVYLAQNLLNRDYMWNRVRVQGGAYGGFADYQIREGVLLLSSYRDPRVRETLEVYRGAAEYLTKLDIGEAELEKMIIGAIGRLDKYQEPETKGWMAFDRHVSGMVPELRQRLRDELLSASFADVHAFGERLEQAIQTGGHIAVLGEREKILQANESLQLGLKVETLV